MVGSWQSVFLAFFFPSISLGEREKKKNPPKKPKQQYFWTSLALYSLRKHFPTYTPSTIYISLANTPSSLRDFAGRSLNPMGFQPSLDAWERPPWTHQDVSDQPVPPETVFGVGSVGRVGVHHHQDVFLVLQREESGVLWVWGDGRNPQIHIFLSHSFPAGELWWYHPRG